MLPILHAHEGGVEMDSMGHVLIVQMPPFSPIYPALQVQLVEAVLPVNDVENAGQFSHAEGPIELLYVPGIHCMHAPCSSEGVNPIPQLHAALRLNPFDLNEYTTGDVVKLASVKSALIPAALVTLGAEFVWP